MNKHEFLTALRFRLRALPAEDIESTVSYYSESIDDRMEAGFTETEAVAALGDFEEIVTQILGDTPAPVAVKEKRGLGIGAILLLILGAPLWLPLILTGLILVLTVIFVLWVLLLTLFVVAVVLTVSGAFCVVASVPALFLSWKTALVLLGGGLVATGVGLLLLLLTRLVKKGVKWITKILFSVILFGFRRKRGNA